MKIFLFQTVHELDSRAQVSFETAEPIAVEPGDVVTLRARVFEVRRQGGYRRSPTLATSQETVSERSAIILDVSEIHLVDVVDDQPGGEP